MRVKNQDIQVILEESGAVKINGRGMYWQTCDDFLPYIQMWNDDYTDVQTYYWRDCAQIRQESYTTGYSLGVRTYYSGFSFDKDLCFAASVEIVITTGQVKLSLTPICDFSGALKKVVWPGPMDFSQIRPDYYTVYPLQQGALIPNGWDREICLEKRWELDAGNLYSRSAYMPWFGQIRGREGYWLMVNTPFDAGFSLEHPAGGACHVGVLWNSQLGKLGYKRECTIVFSDDCDYNSFCKLFRKYLRQTGELCTLNEKILKNPAVEALIGTSIYHTEFAYVNIQPESFFYNKEHPEKNRRCVQFSTIEKNVEALKAKKLQRVYLHLDGWPREGYDNQHPDTFPPNAQAGGWEGFRSLAEKTQACGYQFGIHDQYRDYFKDAPSYHPEMSVKGVDGKAPGCNIWYGGAEEYLCPEHKLGMVMRNFETMKRNGVRLDGAYLDVFSCILLDECYDPLHRVTRAGCMLARKSCFDYVRSEGIIISSEEGVGWAMRDLDLVHHAPYCYDGNEDPTQLCGEILPETIGIAVPLLNLVYHDCVVTPWNMDNQINHQSGFLHALLNGGVPYVEPTFGEEKIEKVKVVSNLHEQVGLQEMVRHEFVVADGSVQRTFFADGTIVTVDFINETYSICKE